MGVAKEFGCTGEESGMEMGPPSCPNLRYTPKQSDSRSRGSGEVAQGAQ